MNDLQKNEPDDQFRHELEIFHIRHRRNRNQKGQQQNFLLSRNNQEENQQYIQIKDCPEIQGFTLFQSPVPDVLS